MYVSTIRLGEARPRKKQYVSIPNQRLLVSAHIAFQKGYAKITDTASNRIRRVLAQYSSGDGIIPVEDKNDVLAEILPIATRIFVGGDDKSAFAKDGTTALAPYGVLLNQIFVRVTVDIVYTHTRQMKRSLPENVFNWLATPFARLEEVTGGEFNDKYDNLRIFTSNPLAKYDPMHSWIDPNGYDLSDRIWNVSQTVRTQINNLVADGITRGLSSEEIASSVERFLNPNRAPLRTNRPYGRDASFDAMRLARTEISRAHAVASQTAALANPFVTGLDWALSLSHPKKDICDSLATLGMSGERLQPPYPVDTVSIPPAHPFCLCRAQPAVEDPDGKMKSIRDAMRDSVGGDLNVVPYVNPTNPERFVAGLLKNQLLEAGLSYLSKLTGAA
jgi:hypothetical protein